MTNMQTFSFRPRSEEMVRVNAVALTAALLIWLVWDAEKAALEVEDYRSAISWAAQTALREVIGVLNLADILIGRAKMDKDLQKIIDQRTTPWGITVQSVEIRDIVIPQDLEDALSR